MTTRTPVRTAILAVLIVLLVIPAPLVLAWKPYTHNYTGDQILDDLVPDGRVTINGREYVVRPEVVTALSNWPEFYSAGTVGPDGFPDLAFGQAVIHPESTGEWLRHMYIRAWQAQSDPAYSPAAREQILAFTYGYMTHAAGDVWGHTFVNDFARGVFPEVSAVLTDIEAASIVLRHFIAEGYAGDATPGFDGNPERGPAPGGDVSDDSTPGIPLNVPHRFIYQTLIRLDVGTPSTERGPLIDFFLDLQVQLEVEKARLDFDRNWTDCSLLDWDCYEKSYTLTVNTVRGARTTTVVRNECIGAVFGCLPSLIDIADDLILNNIGSAYIGAWIDDIKDGLRDWSELGLAAARALFDPQARRDLQNDECRFEGGEGTLTRANCEADVGIVDVLLDQADPFINNHMLSMLGAPDFVGFLREALQAFSDLLEDILGPFVAIFNPIEWTLDEIEEFAKDQVKDLIKEYYGLDVDALADFLTNPTHWVNVTSASLDLPGMGTVTIDFFRPSDHERLDAIIGLPPDHHVPSDFPFPGASTRLSDDAEFNPEDFAPVKNTITTGKLLLLDGSELNRLLGDLLADRGLLRDPSVVGTYQDGVIVPANVMVDSLPVSVCPPAFARASASAGGPFYAHALYLPAVNNSNNFGTTSGQVLADCGPWLQSIDSDHAWRADGLPVFINNDAQKEYARADPEPILRPEDKNGGRGNFPIWESCLLRPAFRDLFVDWENADLNFPDLGDLPSPDPADPEPPVGTLTVSGTTFTRDGTTYLGSDHLFTLSAVDNVFADGALGLQYRVYPDGAVPTEDDWQSLPNGGTFSLPAGAADGMWHIEFRTEDPCHTFSTADELPSGSTHTETFILDTTPPTINITSPAAGAVFDTDDFSSIEYAADDGPLGSGVASDSVTFDGAPAANGDVLDMFFLDPGDHIVAVTATDNLGNRATQTHTFEVHATAESLASNLDRAFDLGLITKHGIHNSLRSKVEAALRAHERGQHRVEHNILRAFVHELEAQRGKAVDVATANRFIAYARDLIATGG